MGLGEEEVRLGLGLRINAESRLIVLSKSKVGLKGGLRSSSTMSSSSHSKSATRIMAILAVVRFFEDRRMIEGDGWS